MVGVRGTVHPLLAWANTCSRPGVWLRTNLGTALSPGSTTTSADALARVVRRARLVARGRARERLITCVVSSAATKASARTYELAVTVVTGAFVRSSDSVLDFESNDA